MIHDTFLVAIIVSIVAFVIYDNSKIRYLPIILISKKIDYTPLVRPIVAEPKLDPRLIPRERRLRVSMEVPPKKAMSAERRKILYGGDIDSKTSGIYGAPSIRK